MLLDCVFVFVIYYQCFMPIVAVSDFASEAVFFERYIDKAAV